MPIDPHPDGLKRRFLEVCQPSNVLNPAFMEPYCARRPKDVLGHFMAGGALPLGWECLCSFSGWQIEYRHTGPVAYVRILDAGHMLRLFDLSERVLSELVHEAYRLDEIQASHISDEEIGLALAGGGAKGAYQIGVWRYLIDAQLDKRITGVSGASVGALNSLLFAQGDLDGAEKLWYHIQSGDLAQFNWNGILPNMLRLSLSSAGPSLVPQALLLRLMRSPLLASPFPGILGALSFPNRAVPLHAIAQADGGLFSQERLQALLSQYISPEAIQNSDKHAFISLANISLSPRREHERIERVLFTPEYVSWYGLSYSEIVEYVLASAALPIWYGSHQIHKKFYVDGGVTDNIPIAPLLALGYKTILAVHLDPDIERNALFPYTLRNDQHAKIYHIAPSKDLGGTMEVSASRTFSRMQQGYFDAEAALSAIYTHTKRDLLDGKV